MNLLLGFPQLLVQLAERHRLTTQTRTPTTMELDDDLLFSDEMPADARGLLDEAERTVTEVRRKSEQAIAGIRDIAEREIAAIRLRMNAEEATVQRDASRELSPLLRDLFTRLKSLQTSYAQTGMIDEALAIRARLRTLRADLFGVKSDPGSMSDFSSSDVGKSFLFEVVGTNEGNVWGTDAYTGDSRVAVAAVHSGSLRVGERGLVRVTIVDGSERLFDGSERHGIRSMDYGNYSVAFQTERV